MNFLLETTTETINWSAVLDTVLSWCLDTGIKILISLLILFVSFRVINAIAKRIEKKSKNNDKNVKRKI